MEAEMLKLVVITIVAAVPLFLSAENVGASQGDKMSGRVRPTLIACPAGTCGSKGFPRAKGIKGCKASNCPK
jgi:hypothetical protein